MAKRKVVKGEDAEPIGIMNDSEGWSKAERILYLWNMLHSASASNGVTVMQIMAQYTSIRESHGEPDLKDDSMRRIVYRDIDFLKSLKFEVKSTGTRPKRYYLGLVALPKLQPANAASAYASMLLQRGTLMEDAVSEAQRYVGSSLKTAIDPAVLEKRVRVIGETITEPAAYGGFLGKLLTGIIEQCVLRVRYINNQGGKRDHQIESLGLVCKRGVWYLIGISQKSGYTVTLRVDQMDSVFVSTEKYHYPEEFSLADYIKPGWGIVCDETVETIELKFSPRVAGRVRRITYHPSQRVIRELKDGSVVMKYNVCGLEEMESWIMGWGAEVEVLRPAVFRLRICKTVEELVLMYQNNSMKRE